MKTQKQELLVFPSTLKSTQYLGPHPFRRRRMISTTLRGRYEGGVREAITTVTVHGGAVKFNGNFTEATFVSGSSLEGLSFSLEKPGSFLIDYDVPKQDVRFQFMNNVRVMGKPLNFTYTHWRGDNRTVVDGMLAIDSSNKLSANYGFDSGNCKLGYSYVHRGLTTFEPSYDFTKNSWDVAVSQRVYEDNVVKASYQSSSKVLGLEWSKNPSSSGGFKICASVNLAEELKFPTLSVDSRLHVEL